MILLHVYKCASLKESKNFLILVIAIFTLLGMASCDYLDKEPDTELTMDMAFENINKVYKSLSYCYSGILSPEEMSYCGAYAADELGDNFILNRTVGDWNYSYEVHLLYDGWTPTSWWEGVGDIFDTYPKLIRQSQLFQQRIHSIPDEGLTQDEVDNMKLECRFLICYYYWVQTMVFGPMPFSPTKAVSSDASTDEYYQKRAPMDSIVNWIDKELLNISEKLPAKYDESNKYGRITSIMALTLRSQMLLFNASPLVNGNSMYKDYANKDGEKLFSQEYDANKWVRAANACKLLIDKADSAGYKLYKEYNTDGSIDPFLSCQNLYFTYASGGNNEITFPYTGWYSGCSNHTWEGYEDIAIARTLGHAGAMGVYQGAIDAFFMKNGLPITNSQSGYKEDGFSSVEDTRDTKFNGDGKVGGITSSGTYNMWCNREPRFYVDVYFQGAYNKALGRKMDFRLSSNLENNGNWNSSPTCYLVRKKIYPDDHGSPNEVNTSRPSIIYRLGITYLDYAEAVNEAYNDHDHRVEALKYLNQIRERAGVRLYSFSVNNDQFIKISDDQDAVRNVVRRERRVETFADGLRFIDIRRWMIAENIPEMNGPAIGMNWQSRDNSKFFQRTEITTHTRSWYKKYYWAPIPQSELDKNTNLVQSPYWE